MTQGAIKGRAAEREVAKILQEWWRRLEPKCEFRRAPLSGGWLGKEGAHIRAHFKVSGDLMTTAEKWPFTVEVKRREGWNLDRFFKGKSSPAWEWWRQAQDQADNEDGVPMLWIRKNQVRPGQPAFPWSVLLPMGYLIDKLPKPDVVWSKGNLFAAGIDFGREVPSLWFRDRLLKVSPRRFVDER